MYHKKCVTRAEDIHQKQGCLISEETNVFRDTQGHASQNRMTIAINEGKITGIDVDRISIELKELLDTKRTTVSLELIHRDVCFGPRMGSANCQATDLSATLILIDEATRFSVVYAVDGNPKKSTASEASLKLSIAIPKRFVVFIPIAILQKQDSTKGRAKHISELVFDHTGYAKNID